MSVSSCQRILFFAVGVAGVRWRVGVGGNKVAPNSFDLPSKMVAGVVSVRPWRVVVCSTFLDLCKERVLSD